MYRGEDRRMASLASGNALRRSLAIGAALVVGAWLAQLALPPQGALAPLLTGAAAALGVVVGSLCLARWVVAGEAPALLLAAASLGYGGVLVGVVELAPLGAPGPADLAQRLQAAATVTLLGLLVLGLLVPPVHTRVRPETVFPAALAVLVAVALVPGIAGGEVLLRGGAAALAAAYGWRGWRRGSWLFGSFALLLLAVALGGPLVRLVGLGLALRGALRQLLADYRDQSESLLTTRISLATAHDRIRASRERAEEQAHEARSALAAIEGATSTLEHYRDRLPTAARAQLVTAVKGEIGRLQRLVDPRSEPVVTFSVGAVLAPVISAELARGAVLDARVPPGLHAVGRPEAASDVVRSLLDNARRYAPGPVTLRATREGGEVVLRVEDRGPGVAAEERATIFARGVRGRAAHGVAGSGLGLAIAAELARDQGGRLWAEDRDGGGACFVLALPAASAVGLDDREDGRERVEEDLLGVPARGHGAEAGVGRGRQPDDDPRSDPARP